MQGKLHLMLLPHLSELYENFIAAEIKNDCFVSVVVPVRNEADHLQSALNSFTRQIDFTHRPLNPNLFEIIIFANNCCDTSAVIARQWRGRNPLLNVHVIETDLPPEHSNIGYVRRVLMNEAERRLRKNKFQAGIIMTTDGDTRVAPNWIAANMREIKNGADAVGGRILINPAEIKMMPVKTKRFHLLDTGYRLAAAELEARLDYVSHDYLPRHHQHFNGSFAVTTDAFRRAGGIPDVRCLEDVAFYQSLLRVDAKFRHSPFVRVETSARRSGRTESGLSTQINEWTIMGENADDYYVESAKAISKRIGLRNRLRRLRQNGAKIFNDEVSALAEQLFVSESFLQTEFERPQTFGAMFEKIEREQSNLGEWAKRNPLVTIEQSLFDLRQILERLRREQLQNHYSFSQTSSR